MEQTHTYTVFQPFQVITAEILYFIPDHPSILQSFIWKDFDKSPDFPKLKHFLEFWGKSLDGKVHSVYVADSGFLKEYEGIKHVEWSTTLN
jgi:uncharacterized protein Usg